MISADFAKDFQNPWAQFWTKLDYVPKASGQLLSGQINAFFLAG